jgi:hypothetical protein
MKRKSFKINFNINDYYDIINILPSITLYINERFISFSWIIFEIDIFY